MEDKNFKEDCREKFSKHKRVYQEFRANRSNFDFPTGSINNIDYPNDQGLVKSPSEFGFVDDE